MAILLQIAQNVCAALGYALLAEGLVSLVRFILKR
jgi:hypothetical protein